MKGARAGRSRFDLNCSCFFPVICASSDVHQPTKVRSPIMISLSTSLRQAASSLLCSVTSVLRSVSGNPFTVQAASIGVRYIHSSTPRLSHENPLVSHPASGYLTFPSYAISSDRASPGVKPIQRQRCLVVAVHPRSKRFRASSMSSQSPVGKAESGKALWQVCTFPSISAPMQDVDSFLV